MDLSVTIAGVRFPNCFMNAAGALCVTQEELEALGSSGSGAIVTKSMTREPREGNPGPRYYTFPGGSINSMGLPNLGYQAYGELLGTLKRFGKPVIASVAGFSEDDFVTIAKYIDEKQPDLMEVNLSCPNVPGEPQIGYDLKASERLLLQVRKVVRCPMGVKLPPYFDPAHHEAMAQMLRRRDIQFLSLINSVGNGLVVDPETETVVIKPKGGFGGLGGTLIKPVALANVRAFWKLFKGKLPIIGTGGVMTGRDAFEHLLCGATALQVGTQLVDEGLAVFPRLLSELQQELEHKGYAGPEECVGRLKEL